MTVYKRAVFLLPGILFLFSGISYSQKEAGKNRTEVIILHANDMHAQIDNMGKLAYLADSLKATHDHVFLVSAGDNFTGNPLVDMVSDKGYPMIDLMNHCGFDVSALGNHEFDMGQELLSRRIKQARFPFICSNMDLSATDMKHVRAYVVLKAGRGIKIPFLGIIQLGQNGLPDSHPSRFDGINFTNGILSAKDHAWLREKYGILIGLTHLGSDTDKALALAVPQFDVIIGGHSHTLIDTSLYWNGVLITQAGWGIKYVGKTTLTIDKGHVSWKREEIICMDSIKNSDKKVQTLIDHYNNNPEFSRIIGVADEPVSGFDELGSFISDALRNQLKTDFAFMNRRGIRIHDLKQGDISIKDIYQMDPFQNDVLIFRMTVDEIISLIRYGYQLRTVTDLAVSGMTYAITTDSNGRYLSAEIKDTSGNPLDPSHEYTVAINNYISSAYDFDHNDPGTSTGITSEEIILQYLEMVGSINYSGVRRTFVVKEQR